MPTIDFQGTTYELFLGTDTGDKILCGKRNDGLWHVYIDGGGGGHSFQEYSFDRSVYIQAGNGNDVLEDRTLAGSDASGILDGGPGADRMYGYGGKTIFIVDNEYDYVSATDYGYGGIPLVFVPLDYVIYASASYALPEHVNTMYLTGNGDTSALGNSAPNAIIGNAGNNTLDGGSGPDSLTGGLGDDVYVVDNPGDVVVEHADEGIDLIETSTTYTAPANVENMTILFGRNANATGNSLDNTLIGNSGINVLSGLRGDDTLIAGIGDDVLIGGIGKDTLIGGSGVDRFKFDSVADSHGKHHDKIVDFGHGEGDQIDLSNIDADDTAPDDQGFAFIDTAGFSGTAGELRHVIRPGHTVVLADVDGDGIADFKVILDSAIDLVGADFVL